MGFQWLPLGTLRPTPPHCQDMMLVVHTATSSICMRVTSTGGQCLNYFPPVGVDSSTLMMLRHWHQWGSYPTMLKTDTYEVNLHYPQHLHDAHNGYPLASESLEIDRDIYSPAQQGSFHRLQLKVNSPQNLRDKVSYVVHYRNLKLYLQSPLANMYN